MKRYLFVLVFLLFGGNVFINNSYASDYLPFLNELRAKVYNQNNYLSQENPIFVQTAKNHNIYLVRNPNRTPHYEVEGKEFFTGVSVIDRLRSASYEVTHSVVAIELISYVYTPTITEALEGFLETAYHRIPLLMPNLEHIGTDKRGVITTVTGVLDYRASWEEPILYPYPAQKGVYRSFVGATENPNPLTPFGIKESGTVVSLTVERPLANKEWKYKATMKKKGGKPIEIFTERYQVSIMDTIFMYPKNPLEPLTTYEVTVEYADKKETWEFTTQGYTKEEFQTLFIDYQPQAYWTNSMEWAIDQKLINGIPNGKQTLLAPTSTLTHGEASLLMERAGGKKGKEEKSPITRGAFLSLVYETVHGEKAPLSTVVDWATASQVLTSTSIQVADYSLERSLTRGEAVTFMYRAFFDHKKEA